MEYTTRVKLEHKEVLGLCLFKLRRKERLVSCSAESMKLWSPDLTLVCSKTLLAAPSSFVGRVGWISGDGFTQGKLLSAGSDFRVRIWNLAKSMEGSGLLHSDVVRDFAVDRLETITCAGRNLFRWRDGKLIETIIADDESDVAAVIKLPSGDFVSAAGSTISVWNVVLGENGSTTTTLVKTLLGHGDDVISLCVKPGGGFISSSRDRSIRSWTGDTFQELVGHAEAVLSVDANAAGLILSGSEDFCAKLWKDGKCVLSLEHPDEVCAVKLLENGDIATACQDGFVRVWTPKNTGGSSDECVDEIMDYSKQITTLENEINYLMKEGISIKIEYSMSILNKEKENLRRAMKKHIAPPSSKNEVKKARFKWSDAMQVALDEILKGVEDEDKVDVGIIREAMDKKFPKIGRKPVKSRVNEWKANQKKNKEKAIVPVPAE